MCSILVAEVGCIYVVSASYGVAGRSAEFVSLPLLGAALPASVFRAVAPALVLCVYAYLHLYVDELLRRLRSFRASAALACLTPSCWR